MIKRKSDNTMIKREKDEKTKQKTNSKQKTECSHNDENKSAGNTAI